MKKPTVGITMGDAAGIGPEITLKCLTHKDIYEMSNPIVIGDAGVMEQVRQLLGSDTLKINGIKDLAEARFEYGIIDVLDYDDIDLDRLVYGKVDEMCGSAAVKYTIEAGKMAMANKIQAMVSAPLNKESMRKAGYKYEGQTEILGELTGSKNYGMLLLLDKLMILLYSNHLSLKDACSAVKKDKLLKNIILANEGLKVFKLENPVIAVSAINPHAGEGGLFGREEIDEIMPAIAEAKEMGINVTGPVPADTVFVKALKGEYDIVVSMYHDHGNLAMKLLGFGSMVTLLVGIPIIRTSVGHGTAFDIAGKNIADHLNLKSAIDAAIDLGAKRF